MRQFFSIFGKKSTSIKVTFSPRKKNRNSSFAGVMDAPQVYGGRGRGGHEWIAVSASFPRILFCFVLFF